MGAGSQEGDRETLEGWVVYLYEAGTSYASYYKD